MSDNIVVAIKARPLIESEKSKPAAWSINDRAVHQIDSNGQTVGEPYCFDHVFGPSSTTEEMYNRVVRDNIKAAMAGFNCTIFAYGQTSSGKTYTMMGTSKSSGIIQLSVNDIFQYMSQHHELQFLISCSYFEIYNENVIDLLSPNQKVLKIREDCQGQVIINTTEAVAATPNAVIDLMNTGNKHRKVGCTKMNKRSSRSHSIFRIKIASAETKDEMKMSYLHLVDLAGSERVSQTKAEGTRLKEGVNINKSLLVLGNVIRQLSEQEGFINYRDSKLTRILQSALGGNSKSLLITTITIVAGEETKSSLEFAQRAKHIENRPVINHIKSNDEKFKDLSKEYQDSISQLEEKARTFEAERDKAMEELQLMKEGINRLMGFDLRGTENVQKKEQRRHTIGSYEPSKEVEIPPLILSSLVSESSRGSDARNSMTPEATEEGEQYFIPKSSTQVETLLVGDEDVTVIMKAKEEIDRSLYVIDEETPSDLLKITPESSRSHLLEAKESTASEYETIESTTTEYSSVSRSSSSIKVTPDKTRSTTSEGLSLEKGDTPVSVLRQRAEGLEKSFEALKEFTSLEKIFVEEEGGYVQRMITEKDKLYNDVLSLETVLKDERLKFFQRNSELQDLVDKLKEENATLKTENVDVKMSRDVLDLKYSQLKDTTDLKIEDLTNQMKEQQKIFDDKVRYFRDQATHQYENEALVKKLGELQLEKECTDMKIAELTKKLSKFEKDEISNEEVLSKLFDLQAILKDSNTQFQGVSTQTDRENGNNEEIKQLTNNLEKVTRECEDANMRINKLESNKSELQELNQDLHRKNEELNSKNKELCRKYDELTITVEEMRTFNKNLQENAKAEKDEEVAKLNKELNYNKKVFQEKEEELKRLAEDLCKTKDSIVDKNEEIRKNVATIKRLNKELMEKDYDSRKKNDDIHNLKQELEKNKKMLADCTGKLNKSSKDICAKNEEIYRLNKQLSHNDHETQKYIEEISILKQEVEKKNHLISTKKNEICKLNKHLSVKNEEILRNVEEINELRNMSHLAEINTLKKVLQDKEEEIKIKNEQISVLNKDLDEQKKNLSRKSREWDVLRKEFSDTNQRCQKKSDELKKLKEKFRGMEGEPQASIDTKYTELEIDLKEKNKRISQLEHQLREQIDNSRKYRDQCREQMNQITKLKVQLAEQKDVLETVERRHREKTTDLPSAKGKVAEKVRKMRVHSLHDSRRSMSESEELDDVETLRADLKHAQEECHKKGKVIKQMQLELEKIRKANDRLNAEKKNYEKGLTELEYFRQECNILGLEVRHFLSENADLRTSLTKQIQSVTTESEQVLLLKSNFETLETSMRELQEMFIQRENTADELRKLKEGFIEVEAKNQQLKDCIQRKEDELDKALKEMADKEKQVREAYNKIVDLQTDKFEMKNQKQFDKAIYENKIVALESKIKELKVSVEPKPKTEEEKSVQTELTLAEMEKADNKYQLTKRLANIRREEIRKLRHRLGIPEDVELM